MKTWSRIIKYILHLQNTDIARKMKMGWIICKI